jgi:Xaa-Pro aminopeptidase
MHELRFIKSNSEKVLMQKSAAAASAGLVKCMRRSKPGVGEWQLASEFGELSKYGP